MEERDLYKVLGVAKGTSEDELRTVYRKLARQFHPDVNPNDPKAEERFKEISFAYGILSDAEKRSRYDEFGMAGLADGFDPEQARAYQRWSAGARRSPSFESFSSHVDLDDLLSGVFGARAPRRPRRGRDAEGEIAVDFNDAVLGREITVQLQGRGPLRVRIPPGADDGTRVRLAGQGESGPEGAPPGDLLLTLRVRSHAFFRRSGSDLLVDVPVTLPELVLGAEVEVPTPEGSVSMKIPPHSANGRRLRVRGKGARGRSDQRGDLYATLALELPEGDEARLEELAREMQALYGEGDVRKRFKGTP